MNPDPITPPYNDGMRDRGANIPLDANPYPQWLAGVSVPNWRWIDWREGWFQRDAELAIALEATP